MIKQSSKKIISTKTKKTSLTILIAIITAGLLLPATISHAADETRRPSGDKEVCKSVRFANPGWSDLTISIGWSSTILRAMGYVPKQVSVGSTLVYEGFKSNNIDVTLGDWLPAGEDLQKKYQGDFVMLGTNMPRVRYSLATTPTAYKAGLRTWQDITKFKKQLNGKIYVIEPGSAGNKHVQEFLKDIDADKDFQVVETSTNAMLSAVEKNINGYVVYLAWEPHWMSKYNPQYLAGGEKWLGVEGKVMTQARKGYDSDCPNLAKFFGNLAFDVGELNKMIIEVDINKKPVEQVARHWLQQHPAQLERWLKGVKTFDGKPALPIVKTALGMYIGM
ncbi:MAG: glycine betaine ABC transporter substrate-binding protein [Hydrotalea sp.]|nr:glycine betaine ABC transporter substrate-binding protein [Hydrotalea sp.]